MRLIWLAYCLTYRCFFFLVWSYNYKLPDGNVIHLTAERSRAPELLFRPSLIGSEVSYFLCFYAFLFQQNLWSCSKRTALTRLILVLWMSQYMGVHEAIFTSISKTDLDMRKALYSQIVLSGGSTMFVGFGDRLLTELIKLVPKDMKVRIAAPPGKWSSSSATFSFSFSLFHYCGVSVVYFIALTQKKKCGRFLVLIAERLHSTWIGGSILASLATFKKMWTTRKEWSEYGPAILHSRTF
jgi:centractin